MARLPVYEHPPAKVRDGSVRGRGIAALIENVFFGLAALLAVLLAFLVLRAGLSSWTTLAYLVGFWALMSYLALPRVHRILTAIYVPNYFFGRARTSDGLLGDPINLALLGSEAQVHAAMERAGWVRADPVDLRSSLRIVGASLARRSYPEAPVSPLLLFGRIQRFAYQKEVEGNPAQRHHVRFWPCPEGWLLPGGHRVDWLAAGTYDRAIGLSLFTLQVTHRIDQNIDIERDFIVGTVRHAVPEVQLRVIEDFSTGYHSRNGGGDRVTTDGDLPVLDLRPVEVPAEDPEEGPGAGKAVEPVTPAADRPGEDALERAGHRPVPIVAAIVLLAISSLIALASAVTTEFPAIAREAASVDPMLGRVTIAAAVTTYVTIYGILALLAWRTFVGSRRARLTMAVLVLTTQVSQVAAYLGSDRPTFLALLSMTIDLLTLYALTTRAARTWTDPALRAAARDPHGSA